MSMNKGTRIALYVGSLVLIFFIAFIYAPLNTSTPFYETQQSIKSLSLCSLYQTPERCVAQDSCDWEQPWVLCPEDADPSCYETGESKGECVKVDYTPPPPVFICEVMSDKEGCEGFGECYWSGTHCGNKGERDAALCASLATKDTCIENDVCFWDLPKVSCPVGDDGSCQEAAKRNATCRVK